MIILNYKAFSLSSLYFSLFIKKIMVYIKHPPRIKSVTLGDDGIGKSSLLITHCKGRGFPKPYVPEQFGGWCINDVRVNGEVFELSYFDTMGCDDYDRFRPIQYVYVDVLLVCFSVVKPSSFKRIKEKWIAEIKEHCPKVPFLIIGTQTDLRQNEQVVSHLEQLGLQAITKEQGERLAWRFGAVKYLECSALTGENVDQVFKEAIITALAYPQEIEKSSRLDTLKRIFTK